MWIKFDEEMHNANNIARLALCEKKIIITYNGREGEKTVDFINTSYAREMYRKIANRLSEEG